MPAAHKAARGSRVSVHYKGTLDDGQVFDSSEDREPLEFTVGEGEVISGFETALIGMTSGEEKTVRLEPAQAYGEYDPELVVAGPRARFPPDVQPGQSFHVHLQGDQEADAVVKEVRKGAILLDFNHPLAGKALTFRLKLVKVEGRP